MLIGFLIRDEKEWETWSAAVQCVPGKSIVHIADKAPSAHGKPYERHSAIDDVESFDEDDGNDDTDASGVLVS